MLQWGEIQKNENKPVPHFCRRHPGPALQGARRSPHPSLRIPSSLLPPSVQTHKAVGPASVPDAVMQGLTWWRGAPEAVTRGAASGGCRGRRGENRGWGLVWERGQETLSTHRNYYSAIISKLGLFQLGVFYIHFQPASRVFYAQVYALFSKIAVSTRCLHVFPPHSCLKVCLCFYSHGRHGEADRAHFSVERDNEGDKPTFTHKLVRTVWTRSMAVGLNAQKCRGLFNARAKCL